MPRGWILSRTPHRDPLRSGCLSRSEWGWAAQAPRQGRRAPLTGGSCATPTCAEAGSGGSPLSPGSSPAGGSAGAPARRSQWPRGCRLCCGDRWGDQGGAGFCNTHAQNGLTCPWGALQLTPCIVADAQPSRPLLTSTQARPSTPFCLPPHCQQPPTEAF